MLSKEEKQRALDLHRKFIVVNASVEPKLESKDIQMMREGGITVSHITTIPDPDSVFREAVLEINDLNLWIEKNRDIAILATTVEDIRRAKKEEKTAMIIAPQDTKLLEGDLRLLKIFHKLGVRVLQLTYQIRNLVGDGCNERTNCELSKFGIKLIEEMDNLGIIIDLSHCGVNTTMEAIEVSKNPVIFSHTNSFSLCKHIRNKSDEQIKALAEKGGVMGIGSYSQYCETREGIRPTIDDFLKHIDYVVKLVGSDHVGIGQGMAERSYSKEYYVEHSKKFPEFYSSGYTYEERFVKDLESIVYLPRVTEGLVDRGYSDQDIEKILGGNFLRVYKKVWK